MAFIGDRVLVLKKCINHNENYSYCMCVRAFVSMRIRTIPILCAYLSE